jgi:hypothetical protein
MITLVSGSGFLMQMLPLLSQGGPAAHGYVETRVSGHRRVASDAFGFNAASMGGVSELPCNVVASIRCCRTAQGGSIDATVTVAALCSWGATSVPPAEHSLVRLCVVGLLQQYHPQSTAWIDTL